MRRAIWFAAGAGVGIYAMVRGRRAAETLTADGMRDRMQALAVGARIFRDEVAQGKAEKESQLRERLGPTYTPELDKGLDTPSLAPRDGYSTNDAEEGQQ